MLFKKKLPKEYVPKSLKKTEEEYKKGREVSYGIAVRDKAEQLVFSKRDASLKKLLEIVPPTGSMIVRFNSDFTEEELYKWQENKWILIEK